MQLLTQPIYSESHFLLGNKLKTLAPTYGRCVVEHDASQIDDVLRLSTAHSLTSFNSGTTTETNGGIKTCLPDSS